MRELKFRYWNEQGKHYHYDQDQVLECLKQQITGIYNHEADGCFFEQFTGMLDKNGKAIFDGDILKTKNHFGEGVGVVRDGGWSFYVKNIKSSREMVWGSPEGEHWRAEETKIIGTIHDAEYKELEK